MVNRAASTPPRLQLRVVPASGSLAVAWYTVPLLFSGTDAVAPEVMVGGLFGGTLPCWTNSNTSSVKGLAMPTTPLRRLAATLLLSPPPPSPVELNPQVTTEPSNLSAAKAVLVEKI